MLYNKKKQAYKLIEINGEKVSIDENCVDMVLFLNSIGMETKFCCEGHDKPIYNIIFDVSEDKIKEFAKKISEWTDVVVLPTNYNRTEWTIKRVKVGLNGYIYKMIWYLNNGELKELWKYQTQGTTVKDAQRQARADLVTLKAIYFGENLEQIQSIQQQNAEIKLKEMMRQDANI